jgi:DNA-binding NtrC family response regulator
MHLHGRRREGPIVRVRCDAGSHETLQRELFGDDSGPPGIRPLPLLEAAFGGTVVIQGLQSMPKECEPRLVRLLETGVLERRSGAEEIPVNVRVVFLWEGELDRAKIKASIGADLMSVLGDPLDIAALDERGGDVPAIAQRIAEQAARDGGRTTPVLSPGVAAVLKRSPWPTNITQLRAVIERAEAQRATAAIELDDLPDEILDSGPARLGGYHERVFEARKKILLDALERTSGNFSEAADLLEINRTYLHRLIRNLEMKDEIAQRFD